MSNKTSVFVCTDMKYHTTSCNGPDTMTLGNLLNLLSLIRPQWLTLASALKTIHDTMGIIGEILPNLFRCQQSFHSLYGTIISLSCHNELRLCCCRNKTGKIISIAAITALLVSRALAELGFLCRICTKYI